MALKQGPRWGSIDRFQIEWKKYEGLYDQFSVKFR